MNIYGSSIGGPPRSDRQSASEKIAVRLKFGRGRFKRYDRNGRRALLEGGVNGMFADPLLQPFHGSDTAGIPGDKFRMLFFLP